MKPVIDPNKCIGCGACTAICPEAFELNATGKAIVKEGVNFDEFSDKLVQAKDGCPMQAITME